MLSHENIKYLFCVHSPRRAQDSAWRFDLVFFRLLGFPRWCRWGVEKARRDLDAGSFQSDLLLLQQCILFIIQEFI